MQVYDVAAGRTAMNGYNSAIDQIRQLAEGLLSKHMANYQQASKDQSSPRFEEAHQALMKAIRTAHEQAQNTTKVGLKHMADAEAVGTSVK
jgi:hypothetical protein